MTAMTTPECASNIAHHYIDIGIWGGGGGGNGDRSLQRLMAPIIAATLFGGRIEGRGIML